MSNIHSSELKDSEKNMYIFPESIVTDELIKALEFHYEHRDCSSYDYYDGDIKLVPCDPYFLCYEHEQSWFHKRKINITKEQIDKYLLLFNVTSISFLEYIEIILNGKDISHE